MTATHDSGEGHGTIGSPQTAIEEATYPLKESANEASIDNVNPMIYSPSPKHEKYGYGSNNPIKTQDEGQFLLDTGYQNGKQIYNITKDGIIVKFQPDNTPYGGYHSYEVSKPRDIPPDILKSMLADGKISKARYTQLRKGKR